MTFPKMPAKRFFAVFLLLMPLSVIAVLRWDWNIIDPFDLYFPKNFLFGVATSAYQVEGGCKNNQWCEHERVTRKKNGDFWMPELSSEACDHWNRYKDDVQLIKDVGANSYRFSIEWSKVEPQEGVFDELSLQHYAEVCDELLRNGICPVVTIHHYSEPLWFAQKGAFEKMENIKYFVRFAAKLFERLGNRVHLWITFSSPTGYAMPSYGVGMKPPYKKNKQLAIEVMKNVLEAHVRVYKKLKSMPGGGQSKIGITKTIYQLDPVHSWDIFAKLFTFMGKNLTNKLFYNFFTTGKLKARIPFMVNVTHKNSDAPQSLDFVALSYYSHAGVKGFGRSAYPGEKKVRKEDHTIYAEGLYRALRELSKSVASKLNIPIYVTENGIAPLEDEQDRDLFLKRYLYALSESIKSGVDVRGYFYWSLMDNYEWGTYSDRYGLYSVDFETQERTLKKSAQHFIDVAARFA